MPNKKGYREDVFDRRHNFIGTIEDVGDGTYNHYDQDGNYLGTTTTKRFNYRKAESERDD